MVPAIIISPDALLADELEGALTLTGGVFVVRRMSAYPDEPTFVRIIRAHGPQLFVVDVRELAASTAAIGVIAANAPGAAVVAVAREQDPDSLIALMRLGIREFVPLAAGPAEFQAAVQRSVAALGHHTAAVEATDLLLSFVPGKPGVGASTVAVNTAIAAAQIPNTRVLLVDFDLNCGTVGFMLHLEHGASIVDAAEHAAQLDEQMWPKLVHKSSGLDVIPAGRLQPGFRIEPAQIRYLLEFARRNYDVICTDLSGLMERYSVEIMQESKAIFLVTTQELPAIYLTRQKADYLRSLDLEGRIRIVLNRINKGTPVSEREVQEVVGLPVSQRLPNDYREVQRALTRGKAVDPKSELGRSFRQIAEALLAREPAPKPQRRLVDYFTMSPARFTFGRGRES